MVWLTALSVSDNFPPVRFPMHRPKWREPCKTYSLPCGARGWGEYQHSGSPYVTYGGPHPLGTALSPYSCAQKGQGGIWSRFCQPCLLARVSAPLLWRVSCVLAPVLAVSCQWRCSPPVRSRIVASLTWRRNGSSPQGDLVVEIGEGGRHATPPRRRGGCAHALLRAWDWAPFASLRARATLLLRVGDLELPSQLCPTHGMLHHLV